MTPGSVFFDEEFAFHDGESGEKLFVVLGTVGSTTVAAKTTSQQHGRGTTFGCQPSDRFYNFFLPKGSCYLKKPTWVCLDELYELDTKKALQKKFAGIIKPVCDLVETIIKDIQLCAVSGQDITESQEEIVKACFAVARAPC